MLKQCVQDFKPDTALHISTVTETLIPPILDFAQVAAAMKRVTFLVNKWSNSSVVRWNSFDLALRQSGIPIGSKSKAYIGNDINWNQDILEGLEPTVVSGNPYVSDRRFVSEWKTIMNTKSGTIAALVTDPIAEVLASIKTIINQSSASSHLKRRALQALNKIEKNVRLLLQALPDSVCVAIDAAFREVTTEEDVGCMIARLNEDSYISVSEQPKGTGVYKRQRDSLHSALGRKGWSSSNIIDRYQDAAVKEMKSQLTKVFNLLIQSVGNKLNDFVDVTE